MSRGWLVAITVWCSRRCDVGFGDEILAAGQAQRLYAHNPFRRVAICDQQSRPRWHPIWDGNPILATPADVDQGEDVQRLMNAPGCRPYIVYPFTEDTGWTFNTAFRAREHVARIYLTVDELRFGVQLQQQIGPYVLIEPYSKHDNLRWPFESWVTLIAALPDLTFVQHTHVESTRVVPGARDVMTRTFRDACGLLASARLYVRGESGMCHAAAALGIPQVTIWGGCMDWNVLGGYPKQIGILNYTGGSPCGRWHPCDHCRRAMAEISVEQVVQSIQTMLTQEGAA